MIINFTREAEKDLAKINKKDTIRIKDKIIQYINDPLRVVCKKLQ